MQDNRTHTLSEALSREIAIHNRRVDQMAANLSNGALAVAGAGVVVPMIDVTYRDRELIEVAGAAGPFIVALWLFVSLGLYWAARTVLGGVR